MTYTRREQITYSMINHMPQGKIDFPALIAQVLADIPGVTEDEVIDCFDDVAGVLEADAIEQRSEAAALESVRKLFEGMPEGTPLGECARIKAEQGDPLAIAFLEWEVQQAGGVQ